MIKIGLLSDTHGHFDEKYYDFFADVDEIWHAGDIGNIEVLNKMEEFKPLRAVYGNIDDHEIRIRTSENLRFKVEDLEVWITHIGGYPGNYDRSVINDIRKNPPGLFICGHSHILKVINDKELGLLHINPGAAGNHGWHKTKTLFRFEISGAEILNLELWEQKR